MSRDPHGHIASESVVLVVIGVIPIGLLAQTCMPHRPHKNYLTYLSAEHPIEPKIWGILLFHSILLRNVADAI